MPRIGNSREAPLEAAQRRRARFGATTISFARAGRSGPGSCRLRGRRCPPARPARAARDRAERPRLRQKAVRRILRVDAALDRVAPLAELILPPRQRLARRRPCSCARTRSSPSTCSVTGCSTCKPRVHLQEVEARRARRTRRAGTRPCRRCGSRQARAAATAASLIARAAPASAPATGSPRSPSDAGAGPSTRARTGDTTCRGRRRRSGPRHAGDARSRRST